jgi:hypothetical protein
MVPEPGNGRVARGRSRSDVTRQHVFSGSVSCGGTFVFVALSSFMSDALGLLQEEGRSEESCMRIANRKGGKRVTLHIRELLREAPPPKWRGASLACHICGGMIYTTATAGRGGARVGKGRGVIYLAGGKAKRGSWGDRESISSIVIWKGGSCFFLLTRARSFGARKGLEHIRCA